MRRRFYFALCFFFSFTVTDAQTVYQEGILPLIPKPVSLNLIAGKFLLSSKTKIFANDSISKSEAEIFNSELERIAGFKLTVLSSRQGISDSGSIHIFRLKNKTLKQDGYELTVHANKISIHGRGAGTFYGLQSLLQLIIQGEENTFPIPCCEIKDFPRYTWRGMHLDVCRHFFPKAFIKKYIDLIALYKMNTFHWHLTDDQGWRIEIKKYPNLTAAGAWRNGSMIGPFNDQKFDTIRYGGFYSQDDIKEIIAYAQQRHVTIVPEIEMPGHSLAALASYPELSCSGGPFEVAKAWGGFDDVYCPKEETFRFIENVLNEVCGLFPGTYIHIGGDECPKVRWKHCNHCQALMKRLHLKNESELQSYFVRRVGKFLKSKGKEMIGWDEILEGGLASGATVMSWRGTEGGIKAAKKRHKVVMTPGSHCYFDHYQGNPDNEPLAIGGYTTIEKVYSYEPTPLGLKTNERKYILGAQGNVWTEYILTPAQVEYMAVPRMCALSEILWSPAETKNYPDFQNRLIKHFYLLDKLNINYSKAIYELKTSVKPLAEQNGVSFELSSPFTSGKIVYSLDGSNLSMSSTVYSFPISINKSCNVKAGYFENGKQKGNTFVQDFFISKSTGKKVILEMLPHENYFCDGAQSLVDGIKGNLHKHGRNWLGWWGKDMTAIIDLGKNEAISKISMNVFDDEPAWIYLPIEIESFTSDDGINFTTLSKISGNEIRKVHGLIETKIDNRSARFIKVIARNAGKIPDGKQGSGNDAWLFVDEISVE